MGRGRRPFRVASRRGGGGNFQLEGLIMALSRTRTEQAAGPVSGSADQSRARPTGFYARVIGLMIDIMHDGPFN